MEFYKPRSSFWRLRWPRFYNIGIIIGITIFARLGLWSRVGCCTDLFFMLIRLPRFIKFRDLSTS